MSQIKRISGSKKVLMAFTVGILASIIVAISGSLIFAPVVGWDIAGITYLILIWRIINNLNGEDTRKHSKLEDPTNSVADTIILFAALASLGAVGLILTKTTDNNIGYNAVLALLAIVSVVISWFVVHTIYTLKYASIYYSDPQGGVDFNESRLPDYLDFIYLSFTIGMTFQVSDTDLSDRKFRAMTIRHALLSYIFGTVIVATTINLIAGLSK